MNIGLVVQITACWVSPVTTLKMFSCLWTSRAFGTSFHLTVLQLVGVWLPACYEVLRGSGLRASAVVSLVLVSKPARQGPCHMGLEAGGSCKEAGGRGCRLGELRHTGFGGRVVWDMLAHDGMWIPVDKAHCFMLLHQDLCSCCASRYHPGLWDFALLESAKSYSKTMFTLVA